MLRPRGMTLFIVWDEGGRGRGDFRMHLLPTEYLRLGAETPLELAVKKGVQGSARQAATASDNRKWLVRRRSDSMSSKYEMRPQGLTGAVAQERCVAQNLWEDFKFRGL